MYFNSDEPRIYSGAGVKCSSLNSSQHKEPLLSAWAASVRGTFGLRGHTLHFESFVPLLVYSLSEYVYRFPRL